MQRARTDHARDQRRQAFIKAALEEFFDRGFSASRMDDIAKRANLSKGTIYLYFESKVALFTAVNETYAIPTIRLLENIAAKSDSAANTLHSLMYYAPAIIERSALPHILKILIGDAGNFPEIIEEYRTYFVDRTLATLIDIIQQGIEQGQIQPCCPRLTARLIAAPILFSAIWKVLFRDHPSTVVNQQELFQLHQKMLFTALGIDDSNLKLIEIAPDFENLDVQSG